MAEVRMDDIPGNSRKNQADIAQGAPKKPEVPVFNGETKQAKRKSCGFVRWFKKMFLSDRKPREILMEVLNERIVPGIKDNFRNSAMATLDSFIYPGSAPGNVTSQNGINYNRIFNSQQARPAIPANPEQTKMDEINKGFGNPCFRTQRDALDFLNMMKGYDYPTLSVHTMYMMQKKHIDYTWDAYGWNREEILALPTSCVRHISGDPEWPWMIALPEAHVIA